MKIIVLILIAFVLAYALSYYRVWTMIELVFIVPVALALVYAWHHTPTENETEYESDED